MVGAAACTRPPPRLRRGSGSDGDGYLHAHVPSCRWRRPMGERGQRPDPGSQAHLGAGGGVRGEPREPVVPAGKEVLRHERRGEGPGPGPRRSTRSGRTGQQERERRREPTPTGGRGSLRAQSPVPQAQRRGWWCPRCSRSGTGVGGALSPLQQAKILASSETPIRMPRASGCHGSAGAGGSRRHCTEQQGPQSTGRWESPSPSSPRALSLSGLGWFPPPPGRAASPSA